MTDYMGQEYVLGIDTSNYTTSVAITDIRRNILCDKRRILKVKQGERGLRQSDALFQHIKNLPALIKSALEAVDANRIAAVSCSISPRPAEGSYMPVFMASKSFAESIAVALNVPCFEFSHQEGHIEAVRRFTPLNKEKVFLACHFSGGTCEILKVSEKENSGYNVAIVGGSKDISFGQVIDRAGVLLGFDFPCGERMDETALKSSAEAGTMTEKAGKMLSPVKVRDGWINLSGMDTQIKNIAEGCGNKALLIREIFEKISDTVYKMILQCTEKTGTDKVIAAGGVASSIFVRNFVKDKFKSGETEVFFDKRGLAGDNAAGISLLGGKALWG